MIIECDSCAVRGLACGECVIGVLLGAPGADAVGPDREDRSGVPSGAPIVQLDAPEKRALDVLAEQGLVPRLRLVAAPARRATESERGTGSVRDAG